MANFKMAHQEKQTPQEVFKGEKPKPDQKAARHDDDSFGEEKGSKHRIRSETKDNISGMLGDLALPANTSRMTVITACTGVVAAVAVFLILSAILW